MPQDSAAFEKISKGFTPRGSGCFPSFLHDAGRQIVEPLDLKMAQVEFVARMQVIGLHKFDIVHGIDFTCFAISKAGSYTFMYPA